MKKIITLTVNPAIDKSTSVARLSSNSKLRCEQPKYEAGGGGINVSRVINELGNTSLCMYMAGGPTGSHLQDILRSLNIQQQVIPIKGWVRENLSVIDTSNHQQYRFGMPGPTVAESEWQNALIQIETVLNRGDFLIASGSLCPGMPVDFYALVSAIANRKGAKYILDTSGEALLRGAQAGVYLLKPNLRELATLCDVETISFFELEGFAKTFLENNPCEILLVSLGAQGAMLITKTITHHIPAPIVYQKSTIGAGDSMVAGMIFALTESKSLLEMAIYGVACGTAATITSGTELCKKKDVEKLNDWILSNSKTFNKTTTKTQLK